MNLEPVSVESPRYLPGERSVARDLRRTAPLGNVFRVDAEPGAPEVLLNQVLIEIALEKIAAQGLCGGECPQKHRRKSLETL